MYHYPSTLTAADGAFVTHGVAADLRRSTTDLQQAVCAKFLQMAQLAVNDFGSLGRHYDRVEYLNGEALELDITRSWRGIVAIEGRRLTLVKFGDHDLIDRKQFSVSAFRQALHGPAIPLLDAVCRSILVNSSLNEEPLRDAFEAHWLYKLDEVQGGHLEEIIRPLEDSVAPPTRTLITGGPGTGKTSILLQVGHLLDWDPAQVSLLASERVTRNLASELSERIAECRLPDLDRVSPSQVLLVDDPATWILLQRAFAVGSYVSARVILVATDLAQVQGIVRDEEIQRFARSSSINHVQLSRCYRQTQGVGTTSLQFLNFISNRFTKFFNNDHRDQFALEHQLSMATANAIEFVSPGGFSDVEPDATNKQIEGFLRRIERSPRWNRGCPLCVVVEPNLSLPPIVGKWIERTNAEVVMLNECEQIRGVEYQYMIVFVSTSTLQDLTVRGRAGLTGQDYVKARNLRIPFSRATDGLIVMGVRQRPAEWSAGSLSIEVHEERPGYLQ